MNKAWAPSKAIITCLMVRPVSEMSSWSVFFFFLFPFFSSKANRMRDKVDRQPLPSGEDVELGPQEVFDRSVSTPFGDETLLCLAAAIATSCANANL